MVKSQVLGIILAASFVTLGCFQTLDSTLRLYAGLPTILDDIAYARDEASVSSAKALLQHADIWTGDADARISRGILARRHASIGSAQADLKGMEEARHDLEEGLARLPAHALGWMELALARYELADLRNAQKAWSTSIAVATYDPALNWWRAQLGFKLLLDMSANDRQLLNQQIAFSWDNNRRDVVAFVAKDRFAGQVIRDALSADTDKLKAYDAAVEGR